MTLPRRMTRHRQLVDRPHLNTMSPENHTFLRLAVTESQKRRQQRKRSRCASHTYSLARVLHKGESGWSNNGLHEDEDAAVGNRIHRDYTHTRRHMSSIHSTHATQVMANNVKKVNCDDNAIEMGLLNVVERVVVIRRVRRRDRGRGYRKSLV